MKTYLFYLHVAVLMGAFNMQGSSNSSSSGAGAAASASASASAAASLQVKTKYDVSQAGSVKAATTPQVPSSGLPSSAGAAASVSAAEVAAGVAQAKAKQEKSVAKTSVDMTAAQAEYEGLVKQQKDLEDERIKNIKKLDDERDRNIKKINDDHDERAKAIGKHYEQCLQTITTRITDNAFNALIQEHKKKNALARQQAQGQAALILKQLQDMPLSPGEVEVNVCQPYGNFRGAANESILTFYRRTKASYGLSLTNSRLVVKGCDMVNFNRKLTVGELFENQWIIAPQPINSRYSVSNVAYTPEEIIKIYNTQMGK